MFAFLLVFAGAIWTLFLFVIVFTVPITIIGGVLFFVLWRNRKNRVVWGNVANKLNFNMPNPKRLEMFGTYKGCKLKTAIRVEYRNTNSDGGTRAKYFTYCTSEFSQPLRFLLSITSPKGYFSGSNQIQLGQPGFDKAFYLKGYDANVLQNLLLSDFPSDKTQNLLGDLMWAKQYIGTIQITDKMVYLERSGQVGDENTLRQLIEITAHLADRFSAARRSFPLADWEKQLLQNWQKFTGENNLVFDSKSFTIQGNYKNFHVLVALETEKEKWQTEMKLKFPNNLMAGLKIMPDNSIHKALTWIGVQDIESGNKAFDDAFIVKSNIGAIVKGKLQPDFCTHLLQIKSRTSNILINDEEIFFTFDSVLGDEQALKSYLEALVITAQMLLR